MGNKKYTDWNKEEDGIKYRKCQDCETWLPMNEQNFKVQPSRKGGFSFKCSKCQENYNHENYMNNRDKQIADAKKWQQDNFEKAKKAKRKHYENNLDKWYERRIAYYETHDNKEIQKRWYENNPEKAKENREYRQMHKKHDITEQQWTACKEYFNNKCAYCGLPIEQHTATRNNKIILMDFHKEHVDDEGSNGLENCVPACTSCNTSKRKYSLKEWYNPKSKRRGGKVFSKERLNKIIKWLTMDYKKYI